MAEKLCDVKMTGGGNKPFYVEAQAYTGYYNFLFPSNSLKQYKYVELLSAAQWNSETGTTAGSPVVSSATLAYGTSHTWTLSQGTPLDLSAINLPDNTIMSILSNQVSGWHYILLKFYD